MINNKATQDNKTISTKRPRMVTVLSSVILLIGAFDLLKFVQVLIKIETLGSLPMTVPPIYLAVDGIVWSISGSFVSWILWTGKSWARKTALVTILLYTITFWIDLIWIAEPTVLQTRWLVYLCLTIIGLPTIYFSLNSKLSQDYFRGNPATID